MIEEMDMSMCPHLNYLAATLSRLPIMSSRDCDRMPYIVHAQFSGPSHIHQNFSYPGRSDTRYEVKPLHDFVQEFAQPWALHHPQSYRHDLQNHLASV